jgi:hypothetical protein
MNHDKVRKQMSVLKKKRASRRRAIIDGVRRQSKVVSVPGPKAKTHRDPLSPKQKVRRKKIRLDARNRPSRQRARIAKAIKRKGGCGCGRKAKEA